MNGRPFSLLLLLLAGLACAQETPLHLPRRSGELWVTLGVETKPFKKAKGRIYEPRFFRKFRSYGELGYRTAENLTGSKLFYTVVGGRYRFNKHVAVGLDWRYNFRDRYDANSSRFDAQVSLGTEVGRFELSYRFNVQHETIPPVRIRTSIRNRAEVEWNTRGFPFDPHASMETFTAPTYQGGTLIGIRYELGTKFGLGKDHDLDVGIRYDREQNLPTLRYRYIFAVAYTYTLR